jgi:tetratricopeptide (TPR) repeat protein
MRRPLGFRRTALVLAVLAASASGCQQSPPPSTPRASTSAKTVDSLKARGDELSQRGQYDGALAVYEEALRQEPNDVALRYAVASTLASLDRRAEATEAFRWVAVNGLPNSELVDRAETWLRAAGAVGTTGAITTPTQPLAEKPPEQSVAESRLRGHITWTNVDPARPAPRVHLRLEGTDPSNKGLVYNTAATLNGDYEFADVRPGAYRLTAQSPLVAVRLWEVDVTVQDGGPTALDLSQASSLALTTSFVPPR